MTWKDALVSIISIFLIVLIAVYFFLPFTNIDFGIGSSKNFNFSLGGNESMQFYPNMRYPTRDISYNIAPDCPIQKSDEATRALGILENDTILHFHQVSDNGEISVNCQDKNIVKGRTFIAGEGGPTGIVEAGNFNVILNGTILLIRDSNCENPNIAIHEFLHALGFNHSANPNNVMYPVTSCSQTIGQDTIDLINNLYSLPSLPDLLFGNVSATMNGRYLDVKVTVKNYGLAESLPAKIEIYADGKVVKSINLDKLEIGDGRIITLSNIFILQPSVKEIKFFIKTDFAELDKENNEVTLNYTG